MQEGGKERLQFLKQNGRGAVFYAKLMIVRDHRFLLNYTLSNDETAAKKCAF